MNIAHIIGDALLNLLLCGYPAMAQVAHPGQTAPVRPVPPTRDPHTLGYIAAEVLPHGPNPLPGTAGNIVIGTTHTPA